MPLVEGQCKLNGRSLARSLVMAGLDPAIHDLELRERKTWMPASSPGMTGVFSTSPPLPGR